MSDIQDKVSAKRKTLPAKASSTKAAPAKASPAPKAAPKVAPKAAPKAEPKAEPVAQEKEHVIPTPEEIDEVRASLPYFAAVKATRETKIGQVQYDGKTPEGFTVRIWAPPGTSMVTGALLTTPQ